MNRYSAIVDFKPSELKQRQVNITAETPEDAIIALHKQYGYLGIIAWDYRESGTQETE